MNQQIGLLLDGGSVTNKVEMNRSSKQLSCRSATHYTVLELDLRESAVQGMEETTKHEKRRTRSHFGQCTTRCACGSNFMALVLSLLAASSMPNKERDLCAGRVEGESMVVLARGSRLGEFCIGSGRARDPFHVTIQGDVFEMASHRSLVHARTVWKRFLISRRRELVVSWKEEFTTKMVWEVRHIRGLCSREQAIKLWSPGRRRRAHARD